MGLSNWVPKRVTSVWLERHHLTSNGAPVPVDLWHVHPRSIVLCKRVLETLFRLVDLGHPEDVVDVADDGEALLWDEIARGVAGWEPWSEISRRQYTQRRRRLPTRRHSLIGSIELNRSSLVTNPAPVPFPSATPSNLPIGTNSSNSPTSVVTFLKPTNTGPHDPQLSPPNGWTSEKFNEIPGQGMDKT
jgi:hypothetical protein